MSKFIFVLSLICVCSYGVQLGSLTRTNDVVSGDEIFEVLVAGSNNVANGTALLAAYSDLESRYINSTSYYSHATLFITKGVYDLGTNQLEVTLPMHIKQFEGNNYVGYGMNSGLARSSRFEQSQIISTDPYPIKLNPSTSYSFESLVLDGIKVAGIDLVNNGTPLPIIFNGCIVTTIRAEDNAQNGFCFFLNSQLNHLTYNDPSNSWDRTSVTFKDSVIVSGISAFNNGCNFSADGPLSWSCENTALYGTNNFARVYGQSGSPICTGGNALNGCQINSTDMFNCPEGILATDFWFFNNCDFWGTETGDSWWDGGSTITNNQVKFQYCTGVWSGMTNTLAIILYCTDENGNTIPNQQP